MGAPKTEGDLVDGDSGYISDDSSFYGDLSHRTTLSSLARSSPPPPHWSNPIHPLHPSPSPPLYNPYATLPCGHQFSEPIRSFLLRLPPHTTPSALLGPWLYVAKPHTTHRPLCSDWAALTTYGTRLLATYTTRRLMLEGKSLPDATLARQLAPLRHTLQQDLLAAAKFARCTSGKWMLFPAPADVDRVWGLVATGTARGELGIAAKVATDGGEGEGKPRLVCVYTGDFSEAGDVRRVVEGLVGMGLVDRSGTGKGVYYKCDAYTHLGIAAGNEWGLKASLFTSKDVMREGGK